MLRIPLGRPYLGTEEQQAILSVMESRLIATGDTVKLFEDALATKFGRTHCVVVNSGTSALYLALKALGIKKVIIPSITCSAVLYAALNAGVRPIFADVDSETHNIDLASLSKYDLTCSEGVIVTHTYGHSADIGSVQHYLNEYSLTLIEDFSQATGGYFKNQILGTFGKISVTSFYGSKIMTTGCGGAILTDDSELYQRCLYGRGGVEEYCYHDLVPLNLRLSDMQSAIGLVQLTKLDRMVKMRRQAAKKLLNVLANEDLKLPVEKEWTKHVYYKFPIVLPQRIEKDHFIQKMAQQGIAVGTLYDPPLHKTTIAKNMLNIRTNLRVSEHLAGRTVSLPIYPEISDGDINRISDAIHKVLAS